jgi:hypothetical protein
MLYNIITKAQKKVKKYKNNDIITPPIINQTSIKSADLNK